jgi:hypothetical protein
LVEYWLVDQKSKDLIIDYIKIRDGEATKNNVVDYMECKDVRYPFPKEYEQYGTTRVTTYSILKELEEAGRIIVIKGVKNGQRHKLIYNDRNTFDHISGQITLIGTALHHHPEQEAQDFYLNQLLINLARVLKYIKNENDKQTLNQKILNALLKIRYKTDKDLASTV